MPKKSKKSLSKRVKLKDKFKIARKVKEHHKKQRKEAKKQEKKKPSVLKDPGIPANYPYREQVIKELQFEHQRIVAQRAEKRKAAQERRQARKEGQNDEDMEDDGADPLQQLAAIREAAEERQSQFEDVQNNPEAKGDGARIGKGNAYYDGFKKVVDSSDVILQVLDARDPCSCRCLEVERYVRKVDPNKRIVVVLNKIDLVPPEIVRKWLIYLREELPAVAFKAATKKKGTIKQIRMPQHSSAAGQSDDLETSECLGADTLMQLLKNYSRSNDVKSVISVGVVGLPNVGKSSVINSLKRSNVAHTGNAPGITKSVQEIHLDKHIRLLDSPGLVTSTAENPAAEALYGGVKIEKAQEPVAAVASILERISSQLLMSVYNIAEFSDCESMLRQVALARGRLRKGGTADLVAAARLVLSDWRDGHIPFHTLPPSRGNEKHETVTVVDGSSSGIDMRALLELEEQQVLAKLQDDDDMDE